MQTILFPLPRWLCLLAFGFAPLSTRSAVSLSRTADSTRATVTPGMPDRGGTYFGTIPNSSKTRHYYIAAEPELWDYTPEGRDPICGKPLPSNVVQQRRSSKVRYVQFTDESFTARVLSEPRLGILGPVLRGVVGDYIAVTLLNRNPRSVSMHPHGVRYDKNSEGSYYEPQPGLGAAVAPGARFTYVWKLDESSGPRTDEPSSKAWLYHSHVYGDEEAALGLVGFIIVTDPNRARPDGTPADVDREMAALFMGFAASDQETEENEAAESVKASANDFTRKLPPTTEADELPAINGLLYGNLHGLEMNEGERVRWYLFALGSEQDSHSAHWHGLKVVEENRRRTDVVELLPASMKVADMLADNPGSWLFHCHVTEHMAHGMFASVAVHPKSNPAANREPGKAFFGLPQADASLQVSKAEARLDPHENCQIKLEGVVSVYEVFSVFAQPVTVQLLQHRVTFKLDPSGQAQMPDGQFRTKNPAAERVVYGMTRGLEMQFEINLQGSQWRDGVNKLVRPSVGGDRPNQRVPVPLTIQIGNTTHHAIAEMTFTNNPD